MRTAAILLLVVFAATIAAHQVLRDRGLPTPDSDRFGTLEGLPACTKGAVELRSGATGWAGLRWDGHRVWAASERGEVELEWPMRDELLGEVLRLPRRKSFRELRARPLRTMRLSGACYGVTMAEFSFEVPELVLHGTFADFFEALMTRRTANAWEGTLRRLQRLSSTSD